MSKELLRRKMTVTEIRILFSTIPQFKYEMWGNTSHSVPGQQVYLGSDDFHYDSPHEALSAGIKHVVDFPDSFQFNHEQVPFLFQVDDKVLYVPNHANGDTEHPDCEKGVVSTVKDQEDGSQKVWVRYSQGPTGALTPTENLVLMQGKKEQGPQIIMMPIATDETVKRMEDKAKAAQEKGAKSVSERIDEFIQGCGGSERDAVNVALTKLELKEQIINHLNECVAALEEKVKVVEAKVDAQEWLKYFDDTVEEFGVAHMVSKKQNMQEIRRELGDTDEIDEYDGGDIWIERLEAQTVTEFPGVQGTLLTDQTHAASGIRTNVQRLEYKHSPTGFNFGYAGSGPADLALNICLMFCNQGRDAYRIYQEFKRTFLCVGQTDRLEIRRGEIENFLLIQGAEPNPNI